MASMAKNNIDELVTKSAINTEKPIQSEKKQDTALNIGSISLESAEDTNACEIKKNVDVAETLDIASLSLESLGFSSSTTVDSSKDKVIPIVCLEKDSDEENSEKTVTVHDSASHEVVMEKKLLVINLNGILVDIVFGHAPSGYTPDKIINGRSVFKRPFCDDFLKFCFEKFDVGIWSSRLNKNMVGVVDFLLGDLKNQLLFSWDQSQCTDTGMKLSQIGLVTPRSNQKPLFLMELKKLWKKYEEYNESNTLLLDDTPHKSLLNPPHTAIFPEEYTFRLQNDYSLGPQGEIRVYLEGLSMAGNVPEYVEQHPFGQTPMVPSRDIYNKLIRK